MPLFRRQFSKADPKRVRKPATPEERSRAAIGGVTLVAASVGFVGIGMLAVGALALGRQLRRRSAERALEAPEDRPEPLEFEPVLKKSRRR
jgi:uncharacterized membrane protein